MTTSSTFVKSKAGRENDGVPPDPIDPPTDDALKPLGRRARKAMAVHQSLFTAGLTAFEREPIGLVSVLDITEGADVAKGVFYLHFKSKDEYLLALWEHVQRGFLDGVRAAVLECRSRNARVESTVRQFVRFAADEPAAARFWVRMSSYFPDEVGEPGHLTRIHHAYVQHLAAMLAGRSFEQLTPDDVRAALLADAICWAVIKSSMTTGEPLYDDETLVRVVSSAIRTRVARNA